MWKTCAEAAGVGVAVGIRVGVGVAVGAGALQATKSNALEAISIGHRKTVRTAQIIARLALTCNNQNHTIVGRAHTMRRLDI